MKKTLAILIAASSMCACTGAVQLSNGSDVLLADSWQIGAEGIESLPASVPSTIAGALFDAGFYPNDLFEADNYKKADKSIFEQPWTYKTSFDAELDAENCQLVFDGLDYRADIFLNGVQIASSDTTFGVFIRREYDVTRLLKRHNELKVTLQKAKVGDLNIGYVDWNPDPLDQSMGIVRPVHIHATGPVGIKDVYVKPSLDIESFKTAELEVMVTLKNFSTNPVEGMIVLSRQDAEGECSVQVAMEALETKEVILTSEQAANLHIDNPRVWWTHDLGTPELYDMSVKFVAGEKVSDAKDVTFGVREIKDRLIEGNYRQFTLNGVDILIKGAGWTDDIFLRDTHESIERQLQYVMDMNMNCVRFENIWGKDDHVYDLCDRYGLLAMLGWSCQWEWESYCGVPEQGRYGCIYTPELMDLAVAYFHDQVIRLHNHASIFAWLTGSDGMAIPELDQRYHEIYDRYEYRPYVCSAKNLFSTTSGWSGTKMDGPYEYVGPEYWYLDTEEGGAFGFNTETCTGASFPQKESIERMIPQDSLWPLSDVWDYHCTASTTNMNSTRKMQEVASSYYGEFTDLDDFLMKAYAVDYNGTRAMFESFRANLPTTTGIVQWMLNSAWPSLYWQVYDWYGVPTAGYYAIKKACEPIQLIFNYKDRKVYAVNETLQPCEVKASMQVLDASSKGIASEEKSVLVPVRQPVAVFDLAVYKGQPHFMALNLAAGDKTADNFYCIPAEDNTYAWGKSKWYILPITKYSDLSFAFAAQPCKVSSKVEECAEGFQVTVTNETETVSYMNILKLKDKDGNLVVPAFWSDNFFPLLPGQSKTVTCKFCKESVTCAKVELANK